jgi:hypothetical protein
MLPLTLLYVQNEEFETAIKITFLFGTNNKRGASKPEPALFCWLDPSGDLYEHFLFRRQKSSFFSCDASALLMRQKNDLAITLTTNGIFSWDKIVMFFSNIPVPYLKIHMLYTLFILLPPPL